jgi:SsrA-binding protein
MPQKILASNRKASFQYHLEERFEAGIALLGSEAKSCREGRVSLGEGYVHLRNDEAFLAGVHISPFSKAAAWVPEPTRERRLLLHKTEIKKLTGRVTQRGYTVVPTKLYLNARGKIKIEIALAKGKKMADKRESIKKRIHDREAEAAMKHHRR